MEGKIRQVRLAVDPRLRLMPMSGDDPPTVEVGPESDQSRQYTFRWPRPVTDRVTLDATFLLNGATGVGNYRLPQIELLDTRPVKRLLAVSVDPTLAHEEHRTTQIVSGPVADFLKCWGAADAEPQIVYCLAAGEAGFAISTRPREPHMSADQKLTLVYDEDRLDVVLDAKIATTSGYVFQHRIAAPPDLSIDGVSLLEGDVERAGRWSRDADGTITVFLNAAASGQQRLVLRGHLPNETSKAFSTPQICLNGCQSLATTARLFQRPSVSLAIRGAGKQAVAESPRDAATPEIERLRATFTWIGRRPPAVAVGVEVNRSEMPRPVAEADGLRKRGQPQEAAGTAKPPRTPPASAPIKQDQGKGQVDVDALDVQQADGDPVSPRLWIAAALAALTGLAGVGRLRENIAAAVHRWPRIAGVTLGLAWWLWLSPSVLGLGIAVASVLLPLRNRPIRSQGAAH